MPFSIKRYPQKWMDYECPLCGVPRLQDTQDPRHLWYWEETNFRGGIPAFTYTFTSMVQSVVSTISSTLYGASRA